MRYAKGLWAFALLACFSANLGFAQIVYFPYYGKNKVLYESFDWKYYTTDHFEIYYYTDDTADLKKIADLAESAYLKISEDIKHQLSARVPLLYYRTSTDFYQSNIGNLPEGVLGVAEPLLYRIAIQGDMTVDEIQDLIEHELAHVFEYDLLWGSPGGVLYALSQPPLWVFEGFAEYATGAWSSWSSLIVRDATLNDRTPDLTTGANLIARYPLPRQPAYDFGHAIFDFIEYKYGKYGIQNFWKAIKGAPFLGRQNPVKRAFGVSVKEFNYEFKKYLRSLHKEFLNRENPEDYSIPIGPEFPLNPYYFAFSHALSPSGDIVAVLLANYKDRDYDIVLFSTKDGSVIKNITKGYTLKYQSIKFEIDPSKGADLAWSPEGDRIAFFGRAGQKHSLLIINALTGRILRDIKIQQDQPSAPCFLSEGDALLFTAFEKGIHDIFKIDLSSGKVENLTSNDLFEKAPSLSPDGRHLVYTIRVDTYDRIFLSPVNNLRKRTQLTFGKGNTITPVFSPDGKEVFFAGDMREAFNIYSVHLETGEMKRYTDVRTGNFFPVIMPSDPETAVFASFNKGAFQVFKSKLEGEVEKTITFADLDDEEEFERFEPIVTVSIDEKKIKPYRGIGKLYMTNRPPIDTVISTDGSIYGGSSLSFSDIFGDHSFNLTVYQVRSFRSYSFSYINQKRRLSFAASAYQYTLYYYTPYAYLDPSLYNYLSYRDALATREITGAEIFAYYPFNIYYRVQANLGFLRYEEDFYDPYINQQLNLLNAGFNRFWNGNTLSLSFSIIGETTRFNYYGPATGSTFRLTLRQALPVTKRYLKNTTFEGDYRKYLYIGADSLLAFRINAFASRGKNPYVFYYGGNNQVRSENFYNIIATEGWIANLEFRFPLVNSASTLIGQIGPVRGVFFVDLTRSKVKGYPAVFYSFLGTDPFGFPVFRTAEAIGSVGYGFEFFFLGLPFHIEFAKRLEIPDFSNPFDFHLYGGFKTKFWIGFDF